MLPAARSSATALRIVFAKCLGMTRNYPRTWQLIQWSSHKPFYRLVSTCVVWSVCRFRNRYLCCGAGFFIVLTFLFVKRCICVTRRPVNSHCSANRVCRMLGYDKKLSPYEAANSMELSQAILSPCEYVSRLIQMSVAQSLTFNEISWICSYYDCDY